MASQRAGMTMAAALAATTAGWAGLAYACDGAGVIIRIDGLPQEVVITRTEAGVPSVVTRPRVLEVVCHGDVVHATGMTAVVLSVDGVGTVKVDHNISYNVPTRTGAPSVVGNAYRTINDQVMPDMKRLPWNVRLKGAGDDFGFALPEMAGGGQQVLAGSRSLLVRLVGGTAPYKVEIRDARNAVVASQTGASHEVVLTGVALKPGAYRIIATDATPLSLDATITAVDTPPPSDSSFSSLADPEIRQAATATSLAHGAPATWSFEAEQQLEAAPANGLDRDKVYELIESYSTD